MDKDFEFEQEHDQAPDLTPEAASVPPEEAPETPAEAPAVSPELSMEAPTVLPETPPTPPAVSPELSMEAPTVLPETPPTPPERRRGGAGLLTGIVAAVVALVLVIVLAGRALAGGSALQRSAKGLASNATVAFLKELCEHGTFRAELGLEELIGYDGTVTLESKSELAGSKTARAAFDLGLSLGGNELADLFFYGDQGRLVLGSDALLPEQGLGVDLAHLSENLDKSVFAPDSGSDYALDRETFDMLKQSLTGGVDSKELTKQIEAVWESAAKMAHKSVKAHAVRDKDSDTLSFGDEQVKVKVLRYEADAEAIYEIALDVLEWAKDSQELRTLLDRVLLEYPALLEEYTGTEAALDSFYTQLNDSILELETGRAEFLEDNEDLKLELELYISKGKGELLGVKLAYEDGWDDVELEAVWGPTLAELANVSVQYDDGYTKYTGSYTVKHNDKQRFSSELKLRENSHTVFSGSFQWDRQDGDFTLKLGDIALEGTLEKLKDGFQAELRRVEAYGSSQALALKLSLRSGADFDPAPAYRELTAMDEAELTQLGQELQMAAYALLQNRDLSGLLYGLMPYYW